MTPQDATDLDLVRAYAEGDLSPGARAAFESRLAAEPDLADTLAAYAGTRDWPEVPVPACATGFDDLPMDDVPAGRAREWLRRRWIPIAAAAAVLVAGVGLSVGGGRGSRADDAAVALRGISLSGDEAVGAVANPEPVPAAIGDYRPSGTRGLRFLSTYEEALAVAAEGRRPIVLFFFHPTCPYCIHLRDQGPFADRDVAAEADAFVWMHVDVTQATDARIRPLVEQGPELDWPYFLVLDPRGKRIGGFGGDFDPASLAAAIREAAAALPAEVRANALAWDAMHRRHDDLLAAEASGDAERRFAELRRLAATDAEAPVGRRARLLLDAAAARGRAALLHAKELAGREGAAAAADAIDAALRAAAADASAALDPAARDDLGRVRDRLRREGRFPELTEAPR